METKPNLTKSFNVLNVKEATINKKISTSIWERSTLIVGNFCKRVSRQLNRLGLSHVMFATKFLWKLNSLRIIEESTPDQRSWRQEVRLTLSNVLIVDLGIQKVRHCESIGKESMITKLRRLIRHKIRNVQWITKILNNMMMIRTIKKVWRVMFHKT